MYGLAFWRGGQVRRYLGQVHRSRSWRHIRFCPGIYHWLYTVIFPTVYRKAWTPRTWLLWHSAGPHLLWQAVIRHHIWMVGLRRGVFSKHMWFFFISIIHTKLTLLPLWIESTLHLMKYSLVGNILQQNISCNQDDSMPSKMLRTQCKWL